MERFKVPIQFPIPNFQILALFCFQIHGYTDRRRGDRDKPEAVHYCTYASSFKKVNYFEAVL